MKNGKYFLVLFMTYLAIEISRFSLTLFRHNESYLSLDFYIGDIWIRIAGVFYAIFLTLVLYFNTRNFDKIKSKKLVRRLNLISLAFFGLCFFEFLYLMLFSQTASRLKIHVSLIFILSLIFIILVFNVWMIKINSLGSNNVKRVITKE